jgi:DNA-binding GntR family transcriptional regulator
MPLTAKGEKIKHAMQQEYGSEKGERVFYASKNKGTISGVDHQQAYFDACRRGDAEGMRGAAAELMRGRIVR